MVLQVYNSVLLGGCDTEVKDRYVARCMRDSLKLQVVRIVLLALFIVYLGTVSIFSLGAMIFRVMVWSIILRLLLLYKKEISQKNKGKTL